MNKITLLLALLICMITGAYGQVTIGEGSNVGQPIPFNAAYGLSYSQSIYLAPEINAAGTITTLQWYYNGTGNLLNSQQLVIYLGHTEKIGFANSTDYINSSEMTQVYAGGIVTNTTPGWKIITLSTAFVYDGTSNLVVAVDENKSGWDSSSDKFRASLVPSNRTLFGYSDTINIDPADPTSDVNGVPTRSIVNYVPNIIFGGITQTCANPSALAVSTAAGLTTQATISWTSSPNETDWEVYVVEQGMPAPSPSTAGTDTSDETTFLKTGLTQNTGYDTYVRARCSETLTSGWVGPKYFRTLCDSFGDFEDNFDTAVVGTGLVPYCWSKVIISTTTAANISVVNNATTNASNAVVMTNTNDLNAEVYFVSPALNAIGANTHRLTFQAKGDAAAQVLIIGTMSDPTDASTFTELQTYSLTTAYLTYNITLNTSTTASHIAFKHGVGGSYRSIYIDNVIWEPIPAAAPTCIVDMTVQIAEGCGNFPTTFTWPAVPGADGYRVSIGTTTDLQELIVDNVDIYSALTYSFSGNLDTTYYYSITPYNANSSAVGCYVSNINTFTTSNEGCYCASVPTSVDNQAIPNVKIQDTDFPIAVLATYTDLSATATVDITQGMTTDMKITMATGKAYFTEIWIDYNDNFNFEPTEIVYSGQSPSTVVGYVYDTSFITSMNANLGEHRMRVVSTFLKQNPANPCYSGIWGVSLDFTVNVLPAPACLPPTSSSTSTITGDSAILNWVGNGMSFNIEYGLEGFVQGTGTVITGNTENSVTISNLEAQNFYQYYVQTVCEVGIESVWVGPFMFVTGCDSFGDFNEDFTTFTTISAPVCWSAIVNSFTPFATLKVVTGANNVEFYNSGDFGAVMYLITPSLTALPLATNHLKFKAYSPTTGTGITVGTMTDANDATTFTAIETVQLSTTLSNYTVPFSNPTTDQFIAFKYAASTSYQYVYLDDVVWEEEALSASHFITDSVIAYPNPVKDLFTIELTQNISNVTVYNLLGQQVMFRNINANRGIIDMSYISAGTYLVKVTTDKEVKTLKVIKE